jgi:primary-amine oxidase
MGIYRVVVIVSFVVLASCGQNSQEMGTNTPTTMSPWHSLTEAEINEATAAVTDAFGEGILFNRISLTEPKKNEARTWQAGDTAARGADIVYRLNKASYITRYDFESAALSAPSEITSGQPMLAGEELFGALDAVNQLPEVAAALERRGITGSDGLCLPRTVGRFFSDLANPVNDRLVRFDCFNIRGQSGLGLLPTTSAYARPVEGISILFDVEELKLIEITDSFADADTPPNDFEVIEFHESALDTRPELKPITIEHPEGLNFSIKASQINWQNWQFHLRFDPRQGTILNNVGVVSDDGFRPKTI